MKIKDFKTFANEQVMVLTEDGELYCGYFIGGDNFNRPAFNWRKIPSIPKDAIEYKNHVELTDAELKALEKKSKTIKVRR